MFDWNDLKYFLAVARAGSTLGGASALKLSQTTAARRIAALESALGARLFERNRSGYRLTEVGEELLAHAERVEAEARALQHAIEQRARRLAGTVRVATNEPLANLLIVPTLRQFGERHPDVRVEVLIDDRVVNLARGEADVALRGAYTTGEGDLVGRRLADLPWSVYASADYAARRGVPDGPEAVARHTVIGGVGLVSRMPGPEWLERQTREPVTTRSDSVTNMLTATRAGLGLAALPSVLADSYEDLVVCFRLPADFTAGLWLLTRQALKTDPCVRAFNDFIAQQVSANRALFRPRESGPPPVLP
ncbi:LysR family transcriptional regulator [Phenylobacterium soli]|uniref:LysR family transcriptional regulator n=1 Tax=Phenylobacterium soli TaxID=2170551 RepID=UPI00140204F7|nr:LysR family transcriptional regulator [Phenylobacterium soli]